MRIILIFCLAVMFINNANAQVDKPQDKTIADTVKLVKIQAQFPGGDKAWARYLYINLNNDIGVKNGAPGGTYQVIISFFVEKDGTVSGINVEDDPGYGMGEEAIRVIKNGPKWTPARINGEIVIDRHRQAVVFRVVDFTNRN